METMKLTVEPRDTAGKGPSRRLRASGKVPAVLYGAGSESQPLILGGHDLHEALLHGQNVVLELTGLAKKETAFAVIKEMQLHPTRRSIQHVDLLRVDLKTEMESGVPVEFLGIPVGVADEGGILDNLYHEVMVRALPVDLPSNFVFDVSALDIGDHVTVADLTIPAGVTVLDEPGTILASVLPPVVHAPSEAEIEAAAEAEAAAAAPAEETPAEAAETGEE